VPHVAAEEECQGAMMAVAKLVDEVATQLGGCGKTAHKTSPRVMSCSGVICNPAVVGRIRNPAAARGVAGKRSGCSGEGTGNQLRRLPSARFFKTLNWLT